MKNPFAYFLMRVVNPVLRRIALWLRSRNIWKHNRKKLKGNTDGRNHYFCRDEISGMWYSMPPVLRRSSEDSEWERSPQSALPLYEEEIWMNLRENPETWNWVRIYTAKEFSAWKKEAITRAVFTDL